MKLKHRRMKTTAHHGAHPEDYGIPSKAPIKAAPETMLYDTLAQVAERKRRTDEQHGPCYRIDPATGARTLIE